MGYIHIYIHRYNDIDRLMFTFLSASAFLNTHTCLTSQNRDLVLKPLHSVIEPAPRSV